MTTAAKTTTRKINPYARQCPVFKKCLENFTPPENLTVDEWADKYRILPASSAEAGPWRTSRTPYLREPMRAFTDPQVNRIVMVASSQVGKSELELNIIGYIIMQDPGSILYIQPSEGDGRKFSRQRIAPMIKACKGLREKVADVKSRDGGNTILQKMFPGGSLTITGSQSAPALSSMPIRYVIGDERDRWADSAGTEGDPWELAQARQITFYNRKSVEVSTPTIKDTSKIEASFYRGTQERWMHRCPCCGEYNEINFESVKHEHKKEIVNNREKHTVRIIGHACPDCGHVYTQNQMRKQPAKWVAADPGAITNGCRSFWLTAFASPWVTWESILLDVYRNENDPEKLKVIYNTKLGKLWEYTESTQTDDKMMARLEDYKAEIPDGVLCLTCGVDTQDDRLEYEVVGWGHSGESWGIKKGIIMGVPDEDEVWQRLDDVIDKRYAFANGRGLSIALTLIDSGGHYTQTIYKKCKERQAKKVFAIKGRGGEGVPIVNPPKRTIIGGKTLNAGKINNAACWRYDIGVDACKAIIYQSLQIEQPGPKYCHFPKGERGYDMTYFNGLLSEHLVRKKTTNGYKLTWEKKPGHKRNEALDCRDYALAAVKILDPDFDALEKRLKNPIQQTSENKQQTPKPRTKPRKKLFDEW